MLCTFVVVNGLNPEIFLEWIDVTCFNNFLDSPERIGNIKGDALFEFLHESPSGHMISYVPKVYKWSKFLFDFWDFSSLNNFDDEYTTSLCVIHYGHSKIYCKWRVLDRYKGNYNRFGLTRNMVDIKLYIPE